jgi:hypothetical protein
VGLARQYWMRCAVVSVAHHGMPLSCSLPCLFLGYADGTLGNGFAMSGIFVFILIIIVFNIGVRLWIRSRRGPGGRLGGRGRPSRRL